VCVRACVHDAVSLQQKSITTYRKEFWVEFTKAVLVLLMPCLGNANLYYSNQISVAPTLACWTGADCHTVES
jgi:hypothetical protein